VRKILLLPVFFGIFLLHALYSLWKGVQVLNQWVHIEGITPLSLYIEGHGYVLGISYALAGAFTVYALLKFSESQKSAAGVLGGFTLTGILYIGTCFLLGCCGSPMLAVYLSLVGSSFLGIAKPLVLVMTAISVVIGYVWIEKKTRTSTSCCIEDEKMIQ
jgi:hypothetical protein